MVNAPVFGPVRVARAAISRLWRAPARSAWTGIDWPEHTRDVLVQGRRVRFIDIGDGPAVLLVHGLGGSWQHWLENLPALAAAGFRVVAVDLAGFGHSDPLPPPPTIARQAGMLAGLLDHLAIAEAVIVGHSLGGMVAMQLVQDHPTRARRLVLVSGGAVDVGGRRIALIMNASAVFDLLFRVPGVMSLVVGNGAVRRLLFGGMVRDPDSLSGELAEQILPGARAPGVRAAGRAAAEAVGTIDPARIACPTLLLWGTRDQLVPLAAGERLASLIPGSTLRTYEGVGHFPMVEVARAFNEAVIEFCHAAASAEAVRSRPRPRVTAASGSTPPRRRGPARARAR